MDPETLARHLGVSPKTLRAWLRRRFPRDSVTHGTPWGDLPPDQVAAATAKFGRRANDSTDRPVGTSGDSLANEVDRLAARRAAANRYRPDRIRLLLVAEAPPRSNDRYFYFDGVSEHDSLFRYVIRGLFGEFPEREAKTSWLDRLRQSGVFLVDVAEDPAGADDLAGHVTGLVERCRSLHPENVILIKVTVYDAAFLLLRNAGLPVIDRRIPFPGSGQQTRFEIAFSEALVEVGHSDGP